MNREERERMIRKRIERKGKRDREQKNKKGERKIRENGKT